ncbi:hypothetical protein JCM10207_002878 [Rhodosporidiobolus poonsookiae]
MSKSLFLLGTGFIGGSVLTALLEKKNYSISALCRDDKKAKKLEELGVRPVRGSLDDDEVISQEAGEADIILHIATADDLPSVKAILKGLGSRSSSKPPAVYIHTSGTGVLTVPEHPVDVIFNDKSPEKFDTLIPDEAPHRKIDLTIKEAVENKKINAKVSIILPPNIYGIGTGPFNRISIQTPRLIREAVKAKKLTIYGPHRWWNNIHIQNLVTAYLTLLSHLESTTTTPPLYIIAETGEHQWKEVGEVVDAELRKRDLIGGETAINPEGSLENETGTQSRSKSEWLHEFGWKVEQLDSVLESIPKEIDQMRADGEF